MAAPIGNQNAKKAKRFEEAIRKALARAHGSVDDGLQVLASKLVAAAENGDQWALREVADRIDGKPSQAIEAAIEHSGEMTVTEKVPLDFDAIRAQREKLQSLREH